MDFREHETQQPLEPMRPTSSPPPRRRRSRGKVFLKLLLVVIFIAGAGAGGWDYRDTQAKDDAKVKQTEVDNLKAANSKLKSDLDAAKKAASEATTNTKPTQADLDNIEAAIKSGNTAALEQLMATKVTVILAASEGLGERTPTQAIKDLDYLDSGTDPWDFDLPAATITSYQAGDYKQYFPVGALMGKSANDYVVSFAFNNSGKISIIFMAANADLL